MKCKKIKDLILTDYPDGQMDEEQKKQIEKHLASCVHCKEYELVTRKTVIEPFSNTERLNPPEIIWHKIKEQIEEKQQQELSSPFADLIRRIKSLLYIPKPALAVATIVIVSLITVTIIRLPSKNPEVMKVNPEKQIECINHLISVFSQDSMNGNKDFGTSIEEYFL